MPIAGSCHCKATRFEIDVAPETVTACTCSICSKRGALWAYYAPEQVRFLAESATTTYQWQTRTVKHNFCSVCGCTTYTQSPDWSSGKPDFDKIRVAINARLLDDFDLGTVPVTVIDGKNLW